MYTPYTGRKQQGTEQGSIIGERALAARERRRRRSEEVRGGGENGFESTQLLFSVKSYIRLKPSSVKSKNL